MPTINTERKNIMNDEKNTRIILLEAENIKRLKAIRITPSGNMIEIAGNNAQGKSSAIDCVEYGLGGKNALPDQPLRNGAEEGYIVLETEHLSIKRTFTKGGNSNLYVKHKKTGLVPEGGPQGILDRMRGELTFDPLEFNRMDNAKQRKTLAKMGNIDLDAVDAQDKALRAKRTEIGREGKRLKAVLEGLTYNEAVAGKLPVDAADLINTLNISRNAQANLSHIQQELMGYNSEKIRLTKELEANALKLQTAQADCTAAEEASSQSVPIDELEAQIANAGSFNAQLEGNSIYKNTDEELSLTTESYEEKTSEIKTLAKNTAEAIANAEFSVAGLELSEDSVMYNGAPFNQASQADKIKVGVCMNVALNPELKIVLIRDGSLLDQTSMALLGSMADMYGLQVWIERVGEGGETAIVIEDGEIKGDA